MMGKTHVTMGIAISMLSTAPSNVQSCMLAIIGGALGGVAADIDTVKNDYEHDALIGQFLGIGITSILLMTDYFLKIGICQSISGRNRFVVIGGMIVYLVLAGIGFTSEHRTFTHSLLSLILFTLAVYMISPSIAIPYSIGYLSHLLLDILNKKRVPVFYPKGKGFCLNLCYANKFGNKFLMWFGLVLSIILVSYSCFVG